MNAQNIRRLFLLGALTMAAPAWAIPDPPTPVVTRRAPARRPVRRTPPAVAPAPVTPPVLVAVGAADLQNALRRLRIYVMNAPDGARVFGNLGAGTQLWFLLPSCRPPQPDDPRDFCPIDRLEVDAVDGGGVRAGPVNTVMAGPIPRRVQAFVLEPTTRMVRMRLITPQGVRHYEGVIAADQVRHLAAPVGRERDATFDFDFSHYPGR